MVLVLLGPLRSWLQPPPVSGLNARLSRDGRLLGHFPYPEAAASELVPVAPGLLLRADAAADFQAMRQAALADGVALGLLSAFRSVGLQRQLFFDVGAERNQTAETRAKVSAPPGFSEHGTGYAVDLADLSAPGTDLSIRFADTRAFRWLSQNAARYHFRMSFPRDNTQGVAFEPWHWRYEGSTTALRLFEPAVRLAIKTSRP
ncbi:MAG: D-alanyl-D-alanine carboxypeptidase family protein [Synechococcaceae cyanobacterium]